MRKRARRHPRKPRACTANGPPASSRHFFVKITTCRRQGVRRTARQTRTRRKFALARNNAAASARAPAGARVWRYGDRHCVQHRRAPPAWNAHPCRAKRVARKSQEQHACRRPEHWSTGAPSADYKRRRDAGGPKMRMRAEKSPAPRCPRTDRSARTHCARTAPAARQNAPAHSPPTPAKAAPRSASGRGDGWIEAVERQSAWVSVSACFHAVG